MDLEGLFGCWGVLWVRVPMVGWSWGNPVGSGSWSVDKCWEVPMGGGFWCARRVHLEDP